MLEGGNKHEYKPSKQYSNRVVALNQLSRTLLSSIGAWKHVSEIRYAPVRKMQVIIIKKKNIILANKNSYFRILQNCIQ